MSKSLVGKLALITGATSGIGKATSKLFVQEGAKVMAIGRNKEALAALAAEIGCMTLQADLLEEGRPKKVVEIATKELGGLTTLVNCAGVLHGGVFGVCDVDNFDINFNTNTRVPFQLMIHAVEHLKAAGKDAYPSIVNVSSVNGMVSFAGVGCYNASKAALDMLTKSAALDLAQFGIRVNSVNPGVVKTDLQRRGGMDEDAYAAFLKRSIEVTHPLGGAYERVCTPEEVGDLIVFLASEKAKFITGDLIKIDGGRGCIGAR